MSYNKETGMYEGYIYKITNSKNGKIYIGQTRQTVRIRYNSHCYGNPNTVVDKAIKKHGKENFQVETIYEIKEKTIDVLQEKLNELEKQYIIKYDSMTKNKKGYNVDAGGSSAEVSKKPIDVYDLNGNFIISYDSRNEAAENLNVDAGSITDCCVGRKQFAKNYIFRKSGDALDKYELPTDCRFGRVKVDQYDLNGIFLGTYKSITIALESNNIDVRYVGQVQSNCNGESKTCQGYIWRYAGDPFDKFDSSKTKIVYCYTTDGKFVQIFESAQAASDYLQLKSKANISSCCSIGIPKTVGGFVWRYKNDSFDKFVTVSNQNKIKHNIVQYSMNGTLIKIHTSAESIYDTLNKKSTILLNNIHSCCKGLRQYTYAYGFVWRYEGDSFDKYDITSNKSNKKPINQYSIDDIFMNEYESSASAGKYMNLKSCTSITACCKHKQNTAYGYKWFYANDPNQPDKTKILTI